MSMSLMRNMRSISALAAIAGALLVCAGVFAQGNVPPSAAPSGAQSSAAPATQTSGAGSLPQDKHEGLTVSADPYTQPARSKSKFDKADPLPVGILSVEVFLHNETTHALRINMETIQLVVHPKNGGDQNVDWMPADGCRRGGRASQGPGSAAAAAFAARHRGQLRQQDGKTGGDFEAPHTRCWTWCHRWVRFTVSCFST